MATEYQWVWRSRAGSVWLTPGPCRWSRCLIAALNRANEAAWQIASKQVCRLHGTRLISHTQMHIWCQEEITCNEYHFPGNKMQMMDLPGGKSARQTWTTQALNCPHMMNFRRHRYYLLPLDFIRDNKNKGCLAVSKWQFSQGWNPWHYTRVGITKESFIFWSWQKTGISPPHTHIFGLLSLWALS